MDWLLNYAISLGYQDQAGRYNALAASKQKPEPTACSFDEEQHITDGSQELDQ